MATPLAIPYQFLNTGPAPSPYVGQDFEEVIKYINDRNAGTVSWDAVTTITLAVTGASTLTSPVTINGSGATTELRLNNTATDGDPLLNWQLSGTTQFSMGVNDGSSDVLQIGTTAIDTGTMWQATSAGEITQPLQPSFIVTLSADVLNVTGDATDYTVIWDTEVRDAGGDYNNSTGVFTAPVTGQYLFCAMPNISGLLSTHTAIYVALVTSNGTYFTRFLTGSNPLSNYAPSPSWLIDMDAADTAYINVRADNGAKVVDIGGGSGSKQSTFSGSLIN